MVKQKGNGKLKGERRKNNSQSSLKRKERGTRKKQKNKVTDIIRAVLMAMNSFIMGFGTLVLVISLLIRFGKGVIDPLLRQIFQSISQMAAQTGLSSDIDLSNFDLAAIIGKSVYVFITFGGVLFIVGGLGLYGAKNRKPLLIFLYIFALTGVVLAEIVGVIFVFSRGDSVDKPLTSALLSSIQNGYEGYNGSDVASLCWNFVMLKLSCCGVDSYVDFNASKSWDRYFETNDVMFKLTTPFPCCKTEYLHIPDNVSCAILPSRNNSNYEKGCYECLWDQVYGQSKIIAAVFVTFLLLQVTLIGLAFYLAREFQSAAKNRNKADDSRRQSRRRRHETSSSSESDCDTTNTEDSEIEDISNTQQRRRRKSIFQWIDRKRRRIRDRRNSNRLDECPDGVTRGSLSQSVPLTMLPGRQQVFHQQLPPAYVPPMVQNQITGYMSPEVTSAINIFDGRAHSMGLNASSLIPMSQSYLPQSFGHPLSPLIAPQMHIAPTPSSPPPMYEQGSHCPKTDGKSQRCVHSQCSPLVHRSSKETEGIDHPRMENNLQGQEVELVIRGSSTCGEPKGDGRRRSSSAAKAEERRIPLKIIGKDGVFSQTLSSFPPSSGRRPGQDTDAKLANTSNKQIPLKIIDKDGRFSRTLEDRPISISGTGSQENTNRTSPLTSVPVRGLSVKLKRSSSRNTNRRGSA